MSLSRQSNAASNPGLASALKTARAAYLERNPKSHAAYTKATESLPGGGTRTTLVVDPFPLMIDSGRGSTITDLDGHTYKDFLSDYTSGIYGKSNPVLLDAIRSALDQGLQFGAHTAHEGRFAAGLVSRFPSMELVRFANSGTEANMLALTAALKHTGRNKVVVFDGAYHGSLLCHFHSGDKGTPEGVVRAPFDFVIAPYNDISGTKALLDPIKADVGAIIVEPMLGAGGCIPAEPEFLRELRGYATEIGAVLIFDEVQTSRLSPGGRQALLGITPDMTTIGKFFGGGFAFGAFGGKREIMEMFDIRKPGAISHGGTFNNSPLTMVAGATALEHLLTREALERLNNLGDYMRDTLNRDLKASGVPFHVKGLGSINQLYCTLPEQDRDAAMEVLFFKLLEKGYWVAQRGTLALNFENNPEEVDGFVSAVVDAAGMVAAVAASTA
ncbi:hypothetical protein CcaverHIS002_0702110 [Cutaneotrichosporon cavernicola]|uniref:Glutamate-1-semialdehyde 2,1-aminomutase n=1 Tax=Cutaneotrichosporon cavernicola TaxID=279322 RepID=A0AA48L9Z8_9TREE|nr:uncharacterized protein CcaverHIS019_0702120 [Cutaneotrichosporon cavernicola]BEI86865.1 hypothetical protein CcaverHIS002_0702110 [Cutaneotrichosporon cavernicola]BEI94640.1 hypothetical protein CcaverHIS019_0702120 [Cutaneotrichosporon cavernicola]BEJ02417.1 hypothetical protein CcaverHIS631_0702120 [Cutaneotrichosporon cavernicola]BEJ10175.1 hypothetical protein CcaverHIS641_0702100 [Cutaneotrichosporon cavernicola]